jgi:hypothetical protein
VSFVVANDETICTCIDGTLFADSLLTVGNVVGHNRPHYTAGMVTDTIAESEFSSERGTHFWG